MLSAEDAMVTQGISVSDLLGKFDYAEKLRRAIKKLCKTQFLSDQDVRVASEIPVQHFRRVADQDAFTPYRLKDGDKTWWSTEENVKAVKAKQQQWGILR